MLSQSWNYYDRAWNYCGLSSKFTIKIGHPYRSIKSAKCVLVAACVGSHLWYLIGGLKFMRVNSWLQNSGTEARICTKDKIFPLWNCRVEASQTICSVSTSFAQCPSAFNPLFLYRVPAKYELLRAISAISKRCPYELIVRVWACPHMTGKHQCLQALFFRKGVSRKRFHTKRKKFGSS